MHSVPAMPSQAASSMNMTSGPRTSPTTMRSGACRLTAHVRSARDTAPRPSMLAGRSTSSSTWSCRRGSAASCSSRSCSSTTMRSLGGHSCSRARMSVVLPRPMPPATRMFIRARIGGAQQAGDALVVHLPVAHQRVLVGVDQSVPPHRHVGPSRHPGRGGEARPVRELEVEQGPGGRELLLDLGRGRRRGPAGRPCGPAPGSARSAPRRCSPPGRPGAPGRRSCADGRCRSRRRRCR